MLTQNTPRLCLRKYNLSFTLSCYKQPLIALCACARSSDSVIRGDMYEYAMTDYFNLQSLIAQSELFALLPEGRS